MRGKKHNIPAIKTILLQVTVTNAVIMTESEWEY